MQSCQVFTRAHNEIPFQFYLTEKWQFHPENSPHWINNFRFRSFSLLKLLWYYWFIDIWLQWTVLSLTQRIVIPVRWGPFLVVKQATTDRVFLCKHCQTSRLLDHSDLDLCWSTHSYLYPPRSQKKLYPWRVFLVLPEYFYILVFSSEFLLLWRVMCSNCAKNYLAQKQILIWMSIVGLNYRLFRQL